LGKGWIASLLALMFFVGLAAVPFVTQGAATPPWEKAAQKASPVYVGPPAGQLSPVVLTSVSTPIQPGDQPASLPPSLSSDRMASLVQSEDLRLRTLLHHIVRITYPTVVPVTPDVGGTFDPITGTMRGTPTLVLPGPATYTIGDLLAAGAATPSTRAGEYVLDDNVLVASGATLKLGGGSFRSLLMATSQTGFTSLVTWGGTLSFAGDSVDAPLSIFGWNTDIKPAGPAPDLGFGRPYIRAVGGELDFKFVHVSNLGFWSGRTGGVAWTGVSSRDSTGGATSSTFVSNTYGAFTSRANHLAFVDDLFENNELDGLRLHRNTVNSTVTGSAAARNGGNGFVVSRGATFNILRGDLAVNNRSNGFLVNGQSLVTGASPSGGTAVASVGIVVRNSEAEANARAGILVEGGAGTVVQDNIICGPITGIAVRAGASNTVVTGNEIRCGGRIAMSIGPGVYGTTVAGNTMTSARIGMLIRNSPGVRIMYNRISDVSLFGISVRGLSPGVVGNSNIIAGRGFQAIDSRSTSESVDITTSDLSGWQHRGTVTFLSYLRFHPLLTTWLVVLVLVVLSSVVIRLRRRPQTPYVYTVPWRPAAPYADGPRPVAEPVAAAAAGLQAPRWRPAPVVANGTAPHERPVPIAPVPQVLWQPFAKAANGAKPQKATPPLAAEAVVAESAAQPNAGRRKTESANAARPLEKVDPPAEVPAAANGNQEKARTPIEAENASTSTPGPFWNFLASGGWAAANNPPQPEAAEQEAPA
jgi:hypothetical protein